MPRFTQYPQQAFDDPETRGAPEDVKISFWQPFSEPIRQLPGVLFAAALIASGAINDPGTLGDSEEIRFSLAILILERLLSKVFFWKAPSSPLAVVVSSIAASIIRIASCAP